MLVRIIWHILLSEYWLIKRASLLNSTSGSINHFINKICCLHCKNQEYYSFTSLNEFITLVAYKIQLLFIKLQGGDLIHYEWTQVFSYTANSNRLFVLLRPQLHKRNAFIKSLFGLLFVISRCLIFEQKSDKHTFVSIYFKIDHGSFWLKWCLSRK